MSNLRKFVSVYFMDCDSAAKAFKAVNHTFPSIVTPAYNLSHVDGLTVRFQRGSTAFSDVTIRDFLLNCPGAISSMK